jgi:hypothetical protein
MPIRNQYLFPCLMKADRSKYLKYVKTSCKCIYTIYKHIVTWRLKAAICPSAGRGFAEHVLVATRNAQLLDGEMLEHVSTATNTTEEAMHCIQSHVDS